MVIARILKYYLNKQYIIISELILSKYLLIVLTLI